MLQSKSKTTGRFVGERAGATRATGRCCHDVLQTPVLHWITDHYVGVLARITLLLGSWELAVFSTMIPGTGVPVLPVPYAALMRNMRLGPLISDILCVNSLDATSATTGSDSSKQC